MLNLATVALGGAFGSIARYYLSNSALKNFVYLDIPFAIVAVNVIGSFIFGIFMGFLENNMILSNNIKLFVITGFLA